jgi:4-amino-4-deoxy-L-arabinose transferase-like glycosyltransferase
LKRLRIRASNIEITAFCADAFSSCDLTMNVSRQSGFNMRTSLAALLIGLCSLALFLSGIGRPSGAIFDESKYVDPAKALLAGIHDTSPDGPPLGKLVLAGSIAIIGDSPFGWRVPSAIFGAITLVGVFLLANLLFDDCALVLATVVLTLLNNFLYIFSRTAMMDIFLVAFAVWGVLAFTAALKLELLGAKKRRGLLAASGLLLGLACACKWNGVDELCVVAAIGGFLYLWSGKSKNPEIVQYGVNLREAGVGWFAAAFLLLPPLAYLATYWPYCRMLHLPFSTHVVIAMNIYIWRFHLAVVGNPPIIIPWYRWPVYTHPLRPLSYLVLNWYIMWVGLAAGIFCLRRFARSLPETLIVLLYGANLLQWAVTPQKCLYYYYYFPAAMFLGMAIPATLNRLPARLFGVRLSLVAVLPAMCVFAYCFARISNLPVPFDCALGCWP